MAIRLLKHPLTIVKSMQKMMKKACEYLEEYTPQKFEDVQNYVEQFKKDFGL